MRNIPLSPIDHVFVGPGSYPIEFVFFYPGGLPKDHFQKRLEAAWNQVHTICPVLSSKLAIENNSYCFASVSADTSPPVSWHQVSGPVHPARHAAPYELVEPVITKPGELMARLKVTEGTDGAVLGFSLSHALADGSTYFMILGAIAQAVRDPGAALPAMDHRRQLLWDFAKDSPYKTSPVVGFANTTQRQDFKRSEIKYSTREFPKEKLATMSAAFAESTKRLSLNDMICADIWRDFTMNLDSDRSEELSFVAPVDFRRLLPDFPKNYAGNGIVLARVDRSRKALLAESPSETANGIRQAVKDVNLDYILRCVSPLTTRVSPDTYGGLGNLHIVDPKGGLLITNLSRMSFATLDFGTGAPTYCRPLTPCRRLVVLMSDGQDGITAHIHA
jgi:Transferase family